MSVFQNLISFEMRWKEEQYNPYSIKKNGPKDVIRMLYICKTEAFCSNLNVTFLGKQTNKQKKNSMHLYTPSYLVLDFF